MLGRHELCRLRAPSWNTGMGQGEGSLLFLNSLYTRVFLQILFIFPILLVSCFTPTREGCVLFTPQSVEGYNSVKFNPNICPLKQLKCSPIFASRGMTNCEELQRMMDETQV